MGELLAEVLLRLVKVAAAAAAGLILYLILVGPFGWPASGELVLLAWLSGAALVLLLERSPI